MEGDEEKRAIKPKNHLKMQTEDNAQNTLQVILQLYEHK